MLTDSQSVRSVVWGLPKYLQVVHGFSVCGLVVGWKFPQFLPRGAMLPTWAVEMEKKAPVPLPK
jgi:hypothetical protein